MRILAAVFSLLLSSVAFAQSTGDIGRMIFVQMLGITTYPGSPFSGNIVNDIVLYFFLPTVLIIVILYMMVGRIFPAGGGYKGLRLLLGVAGYAFIVAGGYFSFFIQLAGPSFVLLVFIMGVLFFFLEFLFGRRNPGGGGSNRIGPVAEGGLRDNPYTGMGKGDLDKLRKQKNEELKKVRAQMRREDRNLENTLARSRGSNLAGGLRIGETKSMLLAKEAELEGDITKIEWAIGLLRGKV